MNDSIRYRADLAAVEQLYEHYRLEGFLATHEKNLQKQEEHLREKLLTDGIKLTPTLSPVFMGFLNRFVNASGLDPKLKFSASHRRLPMQWLFLI